MTPIRNLLGTALVLYVALPTLAVPAAAPSVLTLAAAQRMLAGCMGLTVATRMPPLSVVVIDISGTLVAFQRQDGASPVSADVALQKARSALRARAPTSALAAVAAQDPPTRDGLIALGILSIPGGIPFPVGAAVPLGAVGVSGASPDVDERCANAAVAALADAST